MSDSPNSMTETSTAENKVVSHPDESEHNRRGGTDQNHRGRKKNYSRGDTNNLYSAIAEQEDWQIGYD